ncbi:carbohydrate ABC transporter permease [Paenibacillus methanolicus]|uniref:Multiple sugar transport system permease protein n=1 Tax=Paenibacillus methanolicus TaxID=582686 RepID=A0A5S5CDM9_9BACL|nr:carbohydrate ABC transporter permease [Paenibacillus methanolicus]TYP77447.1 multiple sugar transport system permease protein [Paenibacillus methanolicus]
MKPRIWLKPTAHVILLIGSIIMLFPFIWSVCTSLKNVNEVFTYPPRFFGEELKFTNYTNMTDRFPIIRFFFNTLKITVIVVVFQLITSSMAGYVFARLRFRFREGLFGLYLATLMVPAQVTMIPTFLLMKYYGLLDSHWSLILPSLVSAFGTFLLRQFFSTIPEALEEAAKIDGCTPFGIYWRIFVPLSKPALATLGIFIMLGTWNDFVNPLVFINSMSKMTLTLGLANMQGLYSTDWPALMAATVITVLPILIVFLSAQDIFVRGVTLSGLKEG